MEIKEMTMVAFGATPPCPTYVGGGDLWHEPEPLPPESLLQRVARLARKALLSRYHQKQYRDARKALKEGNDHASSG